MNPPVFYVNEKQLPWREGLVVRDALTMMNYSFRMLVIKLNGELVKKDSYDSTAIPQDADLKVIHLISGG
jgi:thiamine biosynthesis protein ThiS